MDSSRIRFMVTQEIIDTACVRDSSHCLIADSLKAAYPQIRRHSVDISTIRFTDPESGKRYVFFTPTLVQAILTNFDQGFRPSAPFEVVLQRPAQVIRAGRKQLTTKQNKDIPAGSRKELRTQGGHHPIVVGGKVIPTGALSSTARKPRKKADPSKPKVKNPAGSAKVELRPSDEFEQSSVLLSSHGRRRVFGMRTLKP